MVQVEQGTVPWYRGRFLSTGDGSLSWYGDGSLVQGTVPRYRGRFLTPFAGTGATAPAPRGVVGCVSGDNHGASIGEDEQGHAVIADVILFVSGCLVDCTGSLDVD